MREISLENLYLLLFREHLGDSLFLSVTYSNTHTPTHPDPLRHTSNPITDLPLHCRPVIPSSPLHPLIPFSTPHFHSLTPLFPLTLSCSTAISLLHFAINTSREVEENNILFLPRPPPPNSNVPMFSLFLWKHVLESLSLREWQAWN